MRLMVEWPNGLRQPQHVDGRNHHKNQENGYLSTYSTFSCSYCNFLVLVHTQIGS